MKTLKNFLEKRQQNGPAVRKKENEKEDTKE